MEIRINSINDLEQAAAGFLKAIGNRRHIAFHAEMGAGKTTFISALSSLLGMEDEVTSPTFSIINEYQGMSPDGTIRKIYHFDFYRIDTPEEAFDLGLDDYFDSEALCLMEWPEKVETFLPEDTLDVEISVADDGGRIIRIPD